MIKILKRILNELESINKKLQAIESSEEHLKVNCSWSRDGILKVK